MSTESQRTDGQGGRARRGDDDVAYVRSLRPEAPAQLVQNLPASDDDIPRAPAGFTTTTLWPENNARTATAVAAPSLPLVSGVEEWVTCPTCGNGAMVDVSARRAEDFCHTCDFPLFWARSAVIPMSGEATGASLRRLPGTVGRAAAASVACPHCGEPNSPTALICVRCEQPMVVAPPPPAPEPEPVYVPPPPAPEPEPEPAFPWGWVLAVCGLIVIAAVVVSWILLT